MKKNLMILLALIIGIAVLTYKENNKGEIIYVADVEYKVAASANIVDSIIESVDTDGNCPETTDDAVTVTDIEDENGYICSAEDDDGTSYYYRGVVDNNYVYFAGYYWRIIRINGNGSVRIIYQGETADASGVDAVIDDEAFNDNYNDNAYVGYMYGTAGSDNYDDTHANNHDSTIKGVLDAWYETHISGTDYEDYIDFSSSFCNDRSLSDYTTSTYTNLGYYRKPTYYRAANLWNVSSSEYQTFRLTCNRSPYSDEIYHDAFTTSQNTTTGNGALNYPIGLITTDEVVLAGNFNSSTEAYYLSSNISYYLYIGETFLTMTPLEYNYGLGWSVVWKTDGYGNASNYVNVGFPYVVRPVINLTADSLVSGTGTTNCPYTVEETSSCTSDTIDTISDTSTDTNTTDYPDTTDSNTADDTTTQNPNTTAQVIPFIAIPIFILVLIGISVLKRKNKFYKI